MWQVKWEGRVRNVAALLCKSCKLKKEGKTRWPNKDLLISRWWVIKNMGDGRQFKDGLMMHKSIFCSLVFRAITAQLPHRHQNVISTSGRERGKLSRLLSKIQPKIPEQLFSIKTVFFFFWVFFWGRWGGSINFDVLVYYAVHSWNMRAMMLNWYLFIAHKCPRNSHLAGREICLNGSKWRRACCREPAGMSFWTPRIDGNYNCIGFKWWPSPT